MLPDLSTAQARIAKGTLTVAKNGDADQYILTKRQFDPDTGEELDSVVSDVSLAAVDAQITSLQARLDELNAFRETLLSAPPHEAAVDAGGAAEISVP